MSDLSRLADVDDYRIRHGDPDDPDRVQTGLDDASSLVRSVARLTITPTERDVVVLDGNGDRRLLLPEIPVVAVHTVTLDGEALTEDVDYRWWRHGRLERIGACWPNRPRAVTVDYDHGEETEAWIVGLVCEMVHRSIQPWASQGIRAEQLGDHQVSYQVTTAGGALIWLTDDEAQRLETLRGPVFG